MKTRLCLALAMIALGGVAGHAQDIEVTFSNPALRIFQSYTLRAGETARGVLVIANDATLEGHVDGDVLVVLGEARLASTAVVDRSFVVVGGNGIIAEGAQVHGDVVAVGGLDAPPGFSPGGSQVVVGTTPIGERIRGVVPWVTRGLLLGRLIVPDLPWVWTIAAIFFLINLLLNLLLDAPVRASTTALQTTPLSAFATGLLIMLLAGPLCALLAISVIGIVVVPFFIVSLILAMIIGRIAFARWLGASIVRQADAASRGQSLRSFLIGSIIMGIAYMIPVHRDGDVGDGCRVRARGGDAGLRARLQTRKSASATESQGPGDGRANHGCRTRARAASRCGVRRPGRSRGRRAGGHRTA